MLDQSWSIFYQFRLIFDIIGQKVFKNWLRLPERHELFAGLRTGIDNGIGMDSFLQSFYCLKLTETDRRTDGRTNLCFGRLRLQKRGRPKIEDHPKKEDNPKKEEGLKVTTAPSEACSP